MFSNFIERLRQEGKLHYFDSNPTIELRIEKFSFCLDLDIKMYDEFCKEGATRDACDCIRLGKSHCINLIVALMEKIKRDHA